MKEKKGKNRRRISIGNHSPQNVSVKPQIEIVPNQFQISYFGKCTSEKRK